MQTPLGGRIERLEWAPLPGRRPRIAGANARLGSHGQTFHLSLMRVTIAGETGFGWSDCSYDLAKAVVGRPVRDIFAAGQLRSGYESLEFPLLDWWGRVAEQPVYALFAPKVLGKPLEVPCYDTSLLIDDLQLKSDAEAVALLQSEAREGWAQGHRAFKIKIGRGARHMDLEAGTRRDIAVIRGVREVVGRARIMLDANNGYNLNLAKRVLQETADADVYWLEEPFHEDPELFLELKTWLREQNLEVMIADGEGLASPLLVSWAEQGLVDVLQYDIRAYGFLRWLELGRRLDEAGVKSAPHNYGGPYGNYVSGHLAPAVKGFSFVEWDEGQVQGLDASGYTVSEGNVRVPPSPGFGLGLDDDYYAKVVAEVGWSVSV